MFLIYMCSLWVTMENNYVDVDDKNIARLIGVSSIKYKESFILEDYGLNIIATDALRKTKQFYRKLPEKLEVVKQGDYKSGDIWLDKSYYICYLYIGKNEEGKDLTINLGGDTTRLGRLEESIIGHEDSKIKFDEKIYPN